ncbi:uncharacterized protein LOC122075325 [Macadamia integrifolia]|uniref:uncharacterized protein LOC122075325 n=1 Tax=Macadamia integrifolia TaxID=60698 RepID=UPI001C500AB1|nr:uncharacterized protein LOC122075325 [Macadamia integrifolia]
MSSETNQKETEAEAEAVEQNSGMPAPAMDSAAITNLRSVFHRVQLAAERSGRKADQIRVVAASKTKPVSLIRQVYDAGHCCFGENYVQEIVEKAPQLPDDIEWRFIGHLQLRFTLITLPELRSAFCRFLERNSDAGGGRALHAEGNRIGRRREENRVSSIAQLMLFQGFIVFKFSNS